MSKHPDSVRLAALERRPDLDLEVLVEHWTAETRRAGSSWQLRPLQALALEEAALVRGGLFPLGIGCGKTLLSLLLPGALGVEAADCLLLLPANLVAEHHRERARYADHFAFGAIPVLSYEMLSRPDRFEELAQRKPRLIIADEAHALRNKDTARTRRFLAYLRGAGKGTAFVAMSASLAATSLHDWAHLAYYALGSQTPLPVQWSRLDQWARVLDPEHPAPASARDLAVVLDDLGPVASVDKRGAFLAHTADVTGLVRSTEASTPVGLRILTADWTTPGLSDTISDVLSSYMLPCGEEIEDPLRAAEKANTLASGFYYQAVWDEGHPPPRDWFYVRREWASQMRREVARGRPGLDSPALVCAAAERGELPGEVCAAYEAWRAVAGDYTPGSRAIWLDDAPIVRAMAWAREQPNCLVWCAYTAQMDCLAEHGFSVTRPGERPVEGHTALSLASHRRGLNLQAWTHNLYLSCPASAEAWEQSLGRTRRAGQTSNVTALALVGGPGAARLAKARERARYIEETQGVAQALNAATWANLKES